MTALHMPQTMRQDVILVVDDTPANLSLLSGILTERGYAVRVAPGGQLAVQSAQASPPDLILLDIRMPDLDGHEVCRRLKADPRLHDIPVIFISALDSPEDKVSGFDAGGVDYITKPFESREVLARVATHLRLRALQQELHEKNLVLEQANAELERLASTDPLTGLPNRRALLDRGEICLTCARRYNTPYSVILLDIDHFKSVNDRFGHDVGDRVLLAIAKRIQEALRESDILARWGGEEFVILVPQGSREESCQLAERLRAIIAMSDIDPEAGWVTASFGVACNEDGDTLESVIKQADEALYAAKQGGRNQVRCNGSLR